MTRNAGHAQLSDDVRLSLLLGLLLFVCRGASNLSLHNKAVYTAKPCNAAYQWLNAIQIIFLIKKIIDNQGLTGGHYKERINDENTQQKINYLL